MATPKITARTMRLDTRPDYPAIVIAMIAALMATIFLLFATPSHAHDDDAGNAAAYFFGGLLGGHGPRYEDPPTCRRLRVPVYDSNGDFEEWRTQDICEEE